MGVAQRGRVEAPHSLSPAQPADQIVDHIGHESAGENGLQIALRAVVEHRLCRRDLRRSV